MANPSEVSRKGSFKDKLPGIFQGLSISCFITAGISSAIVTPKALQLIEDAKKAKGEDLTVGETIAAGWKPYTIPVIFAAAGTGFGIASCKMLYDYSGTLLAAGIVAEKALLSTTDILKENKEALKDKVLEFSTYKEKVAEEVGEEKEKDISDEVERIVKKYMPVDNNKLSLLRYEAGDILFKDQFTGQFVYTTKDKIRDAIIDLNDMRQDGNDIYLDDYCDALRLNKTSIGECFYWPADSSRKIDVAFGGGDGESEQPFFTIRFRTGCGPIGTLK